MSEIERLRAIYEAAHAYLVVATSHGINHHLTWKARRQLGTVINTYTAAENRAALDRFAESEKREK